VQLPKPSVAFDTKPGAHVMQSCVPGKGAYVPGTHASHTDWLLLGRRLASHVMHEDELKLGAMVPGGHARHVMAPWCGE
jgi:hypothetical protein